MLPSSSGFVHARTPDNLFLSLDPLSQNQLRLTRSNTEPNLRSMFYWDSSLSALSGLAEPFVLPDSMWLSIDSLYSVRCASSKSTAARLVLAPDGSIGAQNPRTGEPLSLVLWDMDGFIHAFPASQLGPGMRALVLSIVLLPAQSKNDLISKVLEPLEPGTPEYQLCQGSSSNQQCFYNRTPNSSQPAFGGLDGNPHSFIGFSKPQTSGIRGGILGTLLAPLASLLGLEQYVYLPPPNNITLSNNIQYSTCWQYNCDCPGQSPDTCSAHTPDPYCHCKIGNQDSVCGLGCAPGFVSTKYGECLFDPTHGIYIQNYQCIKPQVVGIIDSSGKRVCVNWEGTGAQPQGPSFESMRKCAESWAECPPGFGRNLGDRSRPGCYLRGDNMKRQWRGCAGGAAWNKCSASNTDCGLKKPSEGETYSDNLWAAHCHGHCGDSTCECNCFYSGGVPPWGYYCTLDPGGKPKWEQNQSDNTMDPRCRVGHGGDCPDKLRFNIQDNRYCDVASKYTK